MRQTVLRIGAPARPCEPAGGARRGLLGPRPPPARPRRRSVDLAHPPGEIAGRLGLAGGGSAGPGRRRQRAPAAAPGPDLRRREIERYGADRCGPRRGRGSGELRPRRTLATCPRPPAIPDERAALILAAAACRSLPRISPRPRSRPRPPSSRSSGPSRSPGSSGACCGRRGARPGRIFGQVAEGHGLVQTCGRLVLRYHGTAPGVCLAAAGLVCLAFRANGIARSRRLGLVGLCRDLH